MNLLRGQRLKLSDLISHSLPFTIQVIVNAPTLCIDFSCFGLDADNKLSDERYMSFFNQPETPCASVRFDYSTNAAVFAIDLQKLPAHIERLVITAAIDGNGTMSQLINGAAMLCRNTFEAATFAFRGNDFAAEKALMLMEIYRKDGNWRIAAIGQGFNGGLAALVKFFGGTIAEPVADTTTVLNPNTSIHDYKNPNEASYFWKSAGITLNLANITIDGGLLYFGSGLTRMDGSQPEPALIDPKLPVSDIASANYRQRLLSYWPSYSEISADARAAYIKWLVNGRCDPLTDIGYVFLYFYGLERRALVDAKTDAMAKAELPKIIQEVERLLEVYHDNGSFIYYANGLPDFLKLGCAETFSPKQYLSSPPEIISGILPVSLKLALGQLAIDNEPVPADWAYAWFMADSRIRLNSPAKRCATEFKKLFIIRYYESFGNGMRLPVNKTKIKVSYRASSPSFSSYGPIEIKSDIPDVTVLTSRIRKLQALADQCAETLNAYSRFLGRNPELSGTLDALLELPYSLWSEQQKHHLQTIKHTLETTKIPIAIEFTKLKAWLPEWQTITKSRVISFINRLGEAGLVMEPDPRFGGAIPTSDTKVVLFIDDGSWIVPNPRYSTAALTLHLAIVVSLADGEIGRMERTLLIQQIENWLHLETVEKNRLHAHLRWLLSERPNFKTIKKRVETLPVPAREALADFLVLIAYADHKISPNQVKVLEKIYKLLKLDAQSLYGKIHGTSTDEPVTIRLPQPTSSGFAIPRPQEPDSGFQLDMHRVAALKNESKKVTDMLVSLFEQEADKGSLTPAQADEFIVDQDDLLLGLDNDHSALIRLLCSRLQWTRTELEEIAADSGMMLDGALEHINEATYDNFDAPLTEGDDPVDINQDISKELLK